MAQLGVTTERTSRRRCARRTRSTPPAASAPSRRCRARALVYTVTTHGPPDRRRAVRRTSWCAPAARAACCGSRTSRASSSARKTTTSFATAQRPAQRRHRRCSCSPGANALEVADAVEATHGGAVAGASPRASTTTIPFDTTRFVEVVDRGGDHDHRRGRGCWWCWWCSCSCRAGARTLIPMIAVPVSLIGTFAGLWLLGFSINTLTLFALGAGDRHRGRRRHRRARERRAADARAEDAGRARRRSRRCAKFPGAIVAIVLVLSAVFVPVAFLGGIAGAALPAVRGDGGDRGGDLGLRRADPDAGAVRADAARRRTTSRSCSGRSTAASTG